MLNSLSYQPFLISRLQDLTYAAGYIETCLLETSPEPELLKLVLSDVSQALAPQTMTNQKKKDKIPNLVELSTLSFSPRRRTLFV
ncbi:MULTISPECIES: hypothetical protein [Planktothrix]|uniref:hypothetical protein n=1 Tax=Planktothrix TaxID=54304 RepID=UPI0004071C2C|nr:MULTISPECIES: hypothetical protein [Planktothrix]CAD0227919.1 conserved hypothetical protein [Planktothrix agardhii]